MTPLPCPTMPSRACIRALGPETASALVLALLTLLTCSCRMGAPPTGGPGGACPPGSPYAGSRFPGAPPVAAGPRAPMTLPNEAFTGGPGDRGATYPAYAVPMANTAPWGIPLPETMVTPWAPAGIALPWPEDEYLHDGGEHLPVTVNNNGEVRGLELEDTIVHFDTLDGRTLVEPSNRVHIYAPRFAAVRHVEEAAQSLQRDQISQAILPVSPEQSAERLAVTTAVQPVQPIGDTGVKQPTIARLKQAEGAFSSRLLAVAFQGRFKPYEDFEAIRLGFFEDAEKARLMESIAAAITWTHDQAVQVILEKTHAVVLTGDQRAQATFTVDLPDNPKLRVIKVASTSQANPGDIVEFTIRFDNVGDATIGNVTLIDNLTTRLEYVADSSKSSLDAEFFTDPNPGESLVLRWEFAKPLEPGRGGLVRFQCRVR
jgi:uncharacterized repeat protein (TIGR01451 family)